MPSNKSAALCQELKVFIDEKMPLEGRKRREQRELVLREIKDLLQQWLKERWEGDSSILERLGGKICVSGSYRLGINDRDGDIDTICVCPQHVTIEDFFKEEGGFLQKLYERKGVNEINPVPSARVPLIQIEDYKGVKIDLLMACLPRVTVPNDLNISDDKVLDSLNPQDLAVNILRGPRDTEKIGELMEDDFPAFRLCLRLVRYWAKQRNLWGNKYGYIGGVNCNIMVAYICRRAREIRDGVARRGGVSVGKIDGITLLRMFFKWPWYVEETSRREDKWKGNWKQPIRAWNVADGREGNWQPISYNETTGDWKPSPYELMPIITPTYPTMNSLTSVNDSSFKVMRDEILRGRKIIADLGNDATGKDYEKLFEKKCFLGVPFDAFIAVEITGENPEAYQAWQGFASSAMKNFARVLSRHHMRKFISNVCLHPKEFAGKARTPKRAKAFSPSVTSSDATSVTQTSTTTAAQVLASATAVSTSSPPSAVASVNSNKTGESLPTAAQENPKARVELDCFFLIGFDLPKAARQGIMTKHVARERIDYAIIGVLRRMKQWQHRKEGCQITPHILRFEDLPDQAFDAVDGGRATCKELREKAILAREEEAKALATPNQDDQFPDEKEDQILDSTYNEDEGALDTDGALEDEDIDKVSRKPEEPKERPIKNLMAFKRGIQEGWTTQQRKRIKIILD